MSPYPSVPHLLRGLGGAEATRPRVTWYGASGERVELSGRVLVNWVAKSANLLVDEADVAPGDVVALAMPAHWRTLVWALAAVSTGAAVRVGEGPDGGPPTAPDHASVLVVPAPPPGTALPALAPPRGARVLAVALPALAATAPGPLPPGVVDAAQAARSQPDVFVAPEEPAGDDPAWRDAARTLDHDHVLPAAVELATSRGAGPGARVLGTAGTPSDALAWIGVLALDGSLVLCEGGADTEALAAQERVTARI